eukprot:6268115-Amphidinium_carterae.1
MVCWASLASMSQWTGVPTRTRARARTRASTLAEMFPPVAANAATGGTHDKSSNEGGKHICDMATTTALHPRAAEHSAYACTIR